MMNTFDKLLLILTILFITGISVIFAIIITIVVFPLQQSIAWEVRETLRIQFNAPSDGPMPADFIYVMRYFDLIIGFCIVFGMLAFNFIESKKEVS